MKIHIRFMNWLKKELDELEETVAYVKCGGDINIPKLILKAIVITIIACVLCIPIIIIANIEGHEKEEKEEKIVV